MESFTDILFKINSRNKKTTIKNKNNDIQTCSTETLSDEVDSYKKAYELSCPCSGIKCPCGCGHKYGGVCQRPQPCALCEEDLKRTF
tara:strand:+ start:962 stop:1222 length:261 start_codon:yes stop_codon:yes gene_type:complete